MYQFITRDFLRLSKLKFSSNVIEKCFENESSHREIESLLKGETEDQTILEELGPFSSPLDRISFVVDSLAWDLFGNYVLQKITTLKMDNAVKMAVLEQIKNRQAALGQTIHGQKMLSKLRGTHPTLFSKVSAENLVRQRNKGMAGKRTQKQVG